MKRQQVLWFEYPKKLDSKEWSRSRVSVYPAGSTSIRFTDDRWRGDHVHSEPLCASARMNA